jgi:hypothetical protein
MFIPVETIGCLFCTCAYIVVEETTVKRTKNNKHVYLTIASIFTKLTDKRFTICNENTEFLLKKKEYPEKRYS